MPDLIYQVPCNRGGFNHNPNIDEIPPEASVDPSRNVNLHEAGKGTRGGTTKTVTTGYGGARIMGAYDFRLENGNQFEVVVTDDGKIWSGESDEIQHTTWGTDAKPHFEILNNELYISGGGIPQVWTGAGNTTDLAEPSSDWAGTGFPIQLVKHGRGLSERLWAIADYAVYGSKLNDGSTEADFSDVSVIKINIDTGDASGLVGAIEFGDRLLCFGKERAFVIDDSDIDPDNWGYSKAQFEYGVAHFRLLVKTPNDLVGMNDKGDVYSIIAADAYGDYKAISLTKPAHIDRWLREFGRLTFIDDFHAVYNPTLRAIDFFMVRAGETEVDTSLRYFIDRGPMEGWMPQDNQSFASGYSASASYLYKVGAGDYQVRTGDYSGNAWKLETGDKNDDGNGYYSGFKEPHLTYDDPVVTKRYKRGRIITQPAGNFDINVRVWVDGLEKTARTVSLSGTGDIFGTGVFGTAVFGGQELIDTTYHLGYIGRRIQREFFNTASGEDFFVSKNLTDFVPLGNRL